MARPRSPRGDVPGPEAPTPLAPALVPSPASPARLPPKEQRKEIARIVRRLQAIVTTHLETARRLEHPLTVSQVIAVIEALRAEALGTDRPARFSDGEVTFYLMDGLYEELLGEPSNIFYSTPVAEGVTRFEPLPRELWLACLEALRAQIERLTPKGGAV